MRLIDADELTKLLKECQQLDWNSCMAPISWNQAFDNFIYMIDDEPTIETEQVRNALILMVLQYCTDDDGYLWNRCMAAGEAAFEALGVENGDSADELWARLEGEEKDEIN